MADRKIAAMHKEYGKGYRDPNKVSFKCQDELFKDVRVLIRQIIEERNAAVRDIAEMAQYVMDDVCEWCERENCNGCMPGNKHFNWRGAKKEDSND